MINAISNKVLRFLLSKKVINDTEDELAYYKYGIEISLSSIINIILLLTIGLIWKRFLFSIIFLFVFVTLRNLTGGYHANTYFKCNLDMCIVFNCSIIFTLLLKERYNNIISIIFVAVTTITILLFCPVSNKNKPVKKEKHFKFKILSLVSAYIYLIVGNVIYKFNHEYGLLIIITIILIDILVIIPYLIKEGG